MRRLAIAALVLVALSAVWGNRHGLQALLAAPAPPPKPIEFDNGTVREYAAPAEAAPVAGGLRLPQGALRKCVRGPETSYTNIACPAGFREKAVGGPPVNVLPGQVQARAADTRGAGRSPSSLRDALDVPRDDRMRERMVDRLVEGR